MGFIFLSDKTKIHFFSLIAHGQNCHSKHIVSTVKHGGESVVIWLNKSQMFDRLYIQHTMWIYQNTGLQRLVFRRFVI